MNKKQTRGQAGAIENPMSVSECMALLETLPQPHPVKRTVQAALKTGKITSIMIGGVYMVEKQSLLNWMKNVWKPSPGPRAKKERQNHVSNTL